MVLAYAHSEWFVPSLQDLVEPEKGSSRICVWHKAKRSPKSDGAQLIRCSVRIAEQDAIKADQLLEHLRIGRENEAPYLDILRVLSPLLLCKLAHRTLNAEAIFDFWRGELKLKDRSLAREGSLPTQVKTRSESFKTNEGLGTCNASPKLDSPHHSLQRMSLAEVQKQLGITVQTPIKCHGRRKDGTQCGNWINKSNGERVSAILAGLAEDWCLSNTTSRLLEELSGLVMCRRYHQDQAPSKMKEWTTIIKFKEAPEKSQSRRSTAHPQTPTRQATKPATIDTPETQLSTIWTSPRQSRSPQSTATTPDNTFSSGRTSFYSPLNVKMHQPKVDGYPQQPRISPSPISSRTRSNINGGPDQSTASATDSPSFVPLPTVKDPFKAAEYVMEKIKEKISITERLSGFVYGFQRPGCDLIKIGTTRNPVALRMRDIGRSCNYKPNVVFEVATKHAMKVEHLVHRQLYRQNRRENMINGRCNKGQGCASKHKEWFEVSSEYAEASVRAWVRWIDLQPYDVNGFLEPAWVAQTKLFNLRASGDIWMRWTEITLVETVKQEQKEEAIDAAIKAEKVLHTAYEFSTRLVPPKSQVSKTITEARKVMPASTVPSAPVAVLA